MLTYCSLETVVSTWNELLPILWLRQCNAISRMSDLNAVCNYIIGIPFKRSLIPTWITAVFYWCFPELILYDGSTNLLFTQEMISDEPSHHLCNDYVHQYIMCSLGCCRQVAQYFSLYFSHYTSFCLHLEELQDDPS